MIERGEDLAGSAEQVLAGEETKDVAATLDTKAWRFKWERRLTWVTLGVVALFYAALLGFIFIGPFRLTIGPGFHFFAARSLGMADIPVIIALSTVPTLLLIALLRYFHHHDNLQSEGTETFPISVQAMREIFKGIDTTPKP
ncbi:hypothetical protein GCM10007418_09300 [Halopseudomonas salina]|uniref:Uncharacterized protein n=1 Tax=Halopseudomonas salina TaxID=1323744 RepID=A0ABQ1P947_9GAMM|nr:hypothetical protein GCM10007418_09300 [Halopseudomonas salina]